MDMDVVTFNDIGLNAYKTAPGEIYFYLARKGRQILKLLCQVHQFFR